MLLECLAWCALAFPPPKPPHHGLYAYAPGIQVVVDRGTWNDSGDAGIPGWTPYAGAREIHIRPETARAFRHRCGHNAHLMAHLIAAHETAHAIGIVSEAGANEWAYRFVNPPAEYGSLLTTWRKLRLACL